MPAPSSIPHPELLAPAGDMTCLQAALDAGADAVYLGLDRFNMRRMATRNFTRESLPEASRRCRDRGRRLYLTLNCLVYEQELAELAELVAAVQPYVDAAIVSDWAVIDLCRQHGVPFHVSTQMSVSNSMAARRLLEAGARRIVLARECTLAEVRAIHAAVPVGLEVFVHGAMCVGVSGRCLLSHAAYGLSANRGDCLQPCRREYRIRAVDDEAADFVVGRDYVLSPRDLCCLPFLDELVAAGIDACKIEGRGRSPEYVHTVVGAYREALDALREGHLDAARKEALVARCRGVFNREFSVGHYFGRLTPGGFTGGEGNRATHLKNFVGMVRNYYQQAGIVDIEVQDSSFRIGDTLRVLGETTGVVTFAVPEIRREQDSLPEAARGLRVTVPLAVRVRIGDKVYLQVPNPDAAASA
jgi:putative protease